MFKLTDKLKKLLEDPSTIPKADKIFRAFSYFEPKDCKVIIIAQDPYPKAEDACGLAFSVEHSNIPGSLRNIFKELVSDLGGIKPSTGDLSHWAKQGVLLVNTILTTKKGHSLAHKDAGWQDLVKGKIQKVLDNGQPIVLILWGKYAQEFGNSLKLHDKVLVLSGAHPSPLNQGKGFFGGKYFSKANEYLHSHNVEPIKWI